MTYAELVNKYAKQFATEAVMGLPQIGSKDKSDKQSVKEMLSKTMGRMKKNVDLTKQHINRDNLEKEPYYEKAQGLENRAAKATSIDQYTRLVNKANEIYDKEIYPRGIDTNIYRGIGNAGKIALASINRVRRGEKKLFSEDTMLLSELIENYQQALFSDKPVELPRILDVADDGTKNFSEVVNNYQKEYMARMNGYNTFSSKDTLKGIELDKKIKDGTKKLKKKDDKKNFSNNAIKNDMSLVLKNAIAKNFGIVSFDTYRSILFSRGLTSSLTKEQYLAAMRDPEAKQELMSLIR